jgi:hypothetical protein
MAAVTQINFITLNPDKIDEFFEADRRYRASIGLPTGLVSSHLYRSLDGVSAVRVSTYESIEAQKRYHESDQLRRQIAALRPFIESSRPTLYEEVPAAADL